MSGILLVLRAEGYRLLRSRGVWLAALFTLGVPALRVFAAHVTDAATRLQRLRSGRPLPEELPSGDAWAPFVEGWRTGLALAALLLLIHAARSLAGDRRSGVLRLASTRTASRTNLVLGRALLAPVLVVSAVLLSGVGAWLPAQHWFAFGPLVVDGYVVSPAEELQRELWLAVGASLPALLALYAFGLLISSLARGGTSALTVAISLFLAFDLLKDALGEARAWIFATYCPSLVDSSAMQEMVGIARGYSDAGYPPELMRMNLILPWPQALLAVALAAWVLGRRRL